MEGIPVKISEQYKPPRKITLPSSIRNKINATPSFESYDFKLERSVVERFSKLEELKKKQLEKRAKKLEILKKFENSRKKIQAEIEEQPQEISILTPVPIFTQNKTETTRKETNQEGVFNLSDFENDTSSPFDNVELKTINDMEELAHVLGSTNIISQSPRDPNGFSNNWQGNCSSYGYVPNAYIPNLSYPSASLHNSNLQTVGVMNPTSRNYPNSIPNVSNFDNFSGMNAYTNHNQETTLDKEGEEEFSILKGLQQIIDDRRIQVHKLQTPTTSALKNNTPTYLPPPIIEDKSIPLNEQERTFAQNMAEMGFPYPRVARTIQRFGSDQAKVIEFLLQVQSLLENNQFKEEEVEKALELNDYDEEKARQYLDNFIQIKNLGFKEDDIAAALAKTSDRDKALDILIS